MKIAVLGENRQPVLPDGPGGLGRSTHDLATALLARGHAVTLFAPEGSQFDGELVTNPGPMHKVEDFEALLDYSHHHQFAIRFPGAPVVNLIGDRECPWQPPNAAVESQYMHHHYPAARMVRTGIKVDEIPFDERGGDYLLFMALFVDHKGWRQAYRVAGLANVELRLIGPKGDNLPGWLGVPDEAAKLKLLGGALGLLCPYTIDASPRAPLEAAAAGTPTLCLDADGTKDHVKDGVSGFVCSSAADMAGRVPDLKDLSREDCRLWVKQNHDLADTITDLEALLEAVAGGERW